MVTMNGYDSMIVWVQSVSDGRISRFIGHTWFAYRGCTLQGQAKVIAVQADLEKMYKMIDFTRAIRRQHHHILREVKSWL